MTEPDFRPFGAWTPTLKLAWGILGTALLLLLVLGLWLYPAIATGDARCLILHCDPRLVLP